MIDHGLCFHDEPKLRTVIWDFDGEPIPTRMREDLLGARHRARARSACDRLADLLRPVEVRATERRLAELLEEDRFPSPDRLPYPWPIV